MITPNRPADFENPFHVSLFEGPELVSLLQLFFHDVTVQGLEGSPELHADFAQRRASGEKLLRLDPLKLRLRMPRRWYVWGYEHVLPVVYRARAVAHRHRLRSRRDALLHQRRDRADHARDCSRWLAGHAASYLAIKPRES